MQLYPSNAAEALEFNKVCVLLKQKCRSDASRQHVDDIRFHTHIDYVKKELELHLPDNHYN